MSCIYSLPSFRCSLRVFSTSVCGLQRDLPTGLGSVALKFTSAFVVSFGLMTWWLSWATASCPLLAVKSLQFEQTVFLSSAKCLLLGVWLAVLNSSCCCDCSSAVYFFCISTRAANNFFGFLPSFIHFNNHKLVLSFDLLLRGLNIPVLMGQKAY